MVGNVFIHNYDTAYITNLASDGYGTTCGYYRFVNNTFFFSNDYNDYVNDVYMSPFKLTNALESLEMHNNAFYMVDGGPINVVRDVQGESDWTNIDGGPVIDGHSNAITAGSLLEGSAVGSSIYWTSTNDALTEDAFRDFATTDVRPSTTTFTLRGVGTVTPASPTGYPFPNPLWPPVFLPPLQTLEPVGTALRWGPSASIAPDVGAYPYMSQISAGDYHACACLYDGTIACWGDNSYSETGEYFGDTTPTPETPPSLSYTKAIAITAANSGYHSCALVAGGTVYCWGLNNFGQLGDDSTTTSAEAQEVTGLKNAVSIAAGKYHTCAVLGNGTIQCWGYNAYGQLGNGSSGLDAGALEPTPVSGISNAIAVTAGGFHSCALLIDGTIQCWGWDGYGQLGYGLAPDGGSPSDLHEPSASNAVVGITNAIAVTAGESHTCALLANGTIQCWGNNGDGQLGDGFTATLYEPSSDAGAGSVTNAVAISAGFIHPVLFTCLKVRGRVVAVFSMERCTLRQERAWERVKRGQRYMDVHPM